MRTQTIQWKVGVLLSAMALALVGVASGLTTPTDSANAASQRSYGGYWSPYGGWIGNYLNPHTGTFVYCADLWANDVASGGVGVSIDQIAGHPGGTLGGSLGAVLGGTRLVTGDDLQKLNYAVSVHGQTTDNFTAAAVAAYVWSITSDNFYGRGDHFIAGQHADQIRAIYQKVSTDTEAHFDDGTDGAGTITIETDPANHYLGSLEISGLDPVASLGSITLQNAVFADSGLSTETALPNNSSLDIIAVPPAHESSYSVQAQGAFTASIPVKYQSNLQMYTDTGQRSIGPGESLERVNFQLQAEDPMPRSTHFLPVVGTRVASKFVQLGEQFADVLTFSTAADESGVQNPWFQDQTGAFDVVTAEATIYGPFLGQPSESDLVPVGAPIAASGIRVTTTSQDGPTIDYTAQSGVTALEPGFYTWVWSIVAADQPATTQINLPDAYAFQDRFGQVAETSLTPTQLHISTKLTAHELSVGESVADNVTVSLLGGGWVQADQQRVPATLTGVAYFTESKPERGVAPPEGAEIVGRLSLVATGPGTHLSDSLTLPSKPGYVTFHWCLIETEQPVEYQGMLQPTCDEYGHPDETVRVGAPTPPLPSTGAEPNRSLWLTSGAVLLTGIGTVTLGASTLRNDRRRKAAQ